MRKGIVKKHFTLCVKLVVQSEILGFEVCNSAQAIQKSTCDGINPEAKFRQGIHNATPKKWDELS